ncbi:MAG: aminoglycoside adenylyltransferase domain-containing protein [Verrucomicrobiota bacterium]
MSCPDAFPLPPEVAATMSAYERLADDQLPGRIRGLYLSGSLALGDYRAGRSDIDFVAVSDTALEGAELERLRRVHMELRRTVRGPKLDGVYLTWAALAAAPAGLSVPYCLRDRFEPGGDFAVNPVTWRLLEQHALTLRGPARPVVHRDDGMLREWCRENLRSHWGSWARSAQGYGLDRLFSLARELVVWGVLGVARPHATIRTGRMISKTAAGMYALEAFPPRWSAIIREALAGRGGDDRSSCRSIFARRRDLLAFMEYVISDAQK